MKAKFILCATMLALLGACTAIAPANGENDRDNSKTQTDVASVASALPSMPVTAIEVKLTATMKRARALEFLRARLGTKSTVVAAYLQGNAADALAKLVANEDLRAEAMLAMTLSAWAGNKAALKKLDYYLASSKQECGMMAIIGAAFMDPKHEIPLLIKRLGEEAEGSYFRGLTGVVLARITAWDLPNDAARWTKWWTQHEKSYVAQGRIDWDLLTYEIANNPLSGDWQFEVGAETKFVDALKRADLHLRGIGAMPTKLADTLAMLRTDDEYAVSKALGSLLMRDKGSAYYRYLLGAMTIKRGEYKGCAGLYAALAEMNPDLTWSRVLAEYSKKVAAIKDIGEEERIKILVGEIDKVARIKFDADVPAKYLAAQMMKLNPCEVEILARDSEDDAVVAGAMLMMPPEDLVRLGMGPMRTKIADNRIALYAMMQAMDKLEMGMAGAEPRSLAGEFRYVVAKLEKLDPENGVYKAMRAGAAISRGGAMDPKNRPVAAKPKDMDALEAALAKSKFTLYEEETIAAIRAALIKLKHPMPATMTLRIFRETGSCYSSISGIAEHLQTNIIDAVVAGDEKTAARAEALIKKLAEKIASRHKSIDNMELATSLLRHAYNGRAQGLRQAGKNEEAEAITAERNKAQAESQALLFARLDQRPTPPVPVLADMLAEAVLKDEVAFLKKYSLKDDEKKP